MNYTTALNVWARPVTGTREQRAIAAMREVTRLELCLAARVNDLAKIRYRDDIPPDQMNRVEKLRIEFATTDLATARAALQNILKE
jgi:hypothetical protein